MLSPLGTNAEEEFVVDARHGTRQHREILLIEKVVDRTLQGEFRPLERETLFQ